MAANENTTNSTETILSLENRNVLGVKPNGEVSEPAQPAEVFRQVHFQEPAQDEEHKDDDENAYDQDYDHNEDYDGYYNEKDDESAAYYTCESSAAVSCCGSTAAYEHAHIQVKIDQEIYSPMILVTDADTGEIIADMLIRTDTEFQMAGNSCTWSCTDFTSNEPVDKTVTLTFHDESTAMQFYDSCTRSIFAHL